MSKTYVQHLLDGCQEHATKAIEEKDLYSIFLTMRNWGWLREVIASEFYCDKISYKEYQDLMMQADDYYKDMLRLVNDITTYSE